MKNAPKTRRNVSPYQQISLERFEPIRATLESLGWSVRIGSRWASSPLKHLYNIKVTKTKLCILGKHLIEVSSYDITKKSYAELCEIALSADKFCNELVSVKSKEF